MRGIRFCIHWTDIPENKLKLGAHTHTHTFRKIRNFTLLTRTLPET